MFLMYPIVAFKYSVVSELSPEPLFYKLNQEE